ncbi:MAG: 3-dehydroquinate synthase, partial [Myxococcales bacterium]
MAFPEQTMRRMVLEGRTGRCEIAVGGSLEELLRARSIGDGGSAAPSGEAPFTMSVSPDGQAAGAESKGAPESSRPLDFASRVSREATLGVTGGALGFGWSEEVKLIIVTDATVRRLHGARFPDAPVIEIGQGEAAKTLTTVASIYERFLELELDRSAFVLAIGGGIVCDVAAFAASTWMRGVPFGLVPTTLIAQADAGIGGKNGVNLREYKNLVGVFRQPSFCLCDTSFLTTLPDRELRCGLAEVIKHGAIADRALFEFVEERAPALLDLAPDALDRVVSDSLRIKAGIVAIDETEQGERRKLNFGHTLGHAIERIAGLPHGEAVSVGMVLAARLSARRGMLEAKDADRLEALL